MPLNLQERRMYRDLPYGCEVKNFYVFVNQYPVTVRNLWALKILFSGLEDVLRIMVFRVTMLAMVDDAHRFYSFNR